MDDKKVCIALGSSVYKNQIAQKTVSVTKLFRELSKPEIRGKKDGPYFVFAKFTENVRHAVNVVEYHGATIDLDDTPLTVKEIQEKFKRYKYCIYTTHSHKAKGKGNRYRLVLPYSHAVGPKLHVSTMFKIMKTLGFDKVDTSSKALSRPMYLPACPKERKRHFRSFKNLDGRFYKPSEKYDAQAAWENADDPDEADKFDPNSDVDHGNRDNSLARFAGRMFSTGSSLETALEASRIWNETKCHPPKSNKDVERIVGSIYKAHARNTGDTGWGYEELLRRVETSKTIMEDYPLFVMMIGSTDKLSRSELELLTRKLKTRTGMPLSIIKDEVAAHKKAQRIDKEDAKEEKQTLADSTIQEVRKAFQDWVYVSRDDRMFNFRNGEMYKKEGFNNRHMSQMEVGNSLGMLLQNDAIRITDMVQFNPAEPQIYEENGSVYANTYIAPEVFPLPGDVRPLLRHMRYLFPDKREADIVLDFIAYMVQNPGDKIIWVPIIKGMKGIGKSIIADEVARAVLGIYNVAPVDTKMIGGSFNSWQADKQLIVFHELRVGQSRQDKLLMTESLKEFVTDKYIMLHRKGIDPYQVLNLTNMMAFTNYDDSILITKDERRFTMLRTEAFPRSNKYYARFINWIRTHREEMLYFFQHRSLKNFDPKNAPETSYTNEIKGASVMWPSNILYEAMEDPEHPFNTDGVVSWTMIVNYIKAKSVGDDVFRAESLMKASSSKGYQLYNTLMEMGFRKWKNPRGNDERIFCNGKQERVWISPKFMRTHKNMSASRVKHIIMKQKTVYDFDED